MMKANPFLQPSTLEHELPPFSQIKEEHYLPAFYEGFSQEETAKFLEISLSTVKRRWHAARLKLAETF